MLLIIDNYLAVTISMSMYIYYRIHVNKVKLQNCRDTSFESYIYKFKYHKSEHLNAIPE
jgi:hypothetical protein